MSYDIKNELDPLLIERMKNSLKHLIEKNFIKNLNEAVLMNSMMMSSDLRKEVMQQLGQVENIGQEVDESIN